MDWKTIAIVISLLISNTSLADSPIPAKDQPQTFRDCVIANKKSAKDPRPAYRKCKDTRESLKVSQYEILAGMQWYLPEIRKCYEKALKTQDKLQGKLTVRFKITNGGDVTSCEYTEGLTSAPLRACVCPSIKKWFFPENKGEEPVTITYPFRFNPL